MKILVTGGAGYIGSVVVQQLLDRGDEVYVFDNFVQGHREAVKDTSLIVDGDIRDLAHLRATMLDLKPEAVIHLAALVAVSDSVKDPAIYFDVNGVGTLNVLKEMAWADIKKLVFASSAAVYGDLPADPVKEDHLLNPLNPYGQTKMWGEQMIKAYCEAAGVNATCFRFFNVAGSDGTHGEDHHPETHLFPSVIKAALDDLPIPIYGHDYETKDGTAVRDFIDVRDIARAHVMALDKLDGFQVFNLGNGKGFTCLEVVDAIAEASEKFIVSKKCPRRPGDIAGMVADWSKAKGELGWEPQHSLQDMASSAWAWAQAHPRGYGG